jgi:heme/copper-type cytochrome/quinol oxidase subunit 2
MARPNVSPTEKVEAARFHYIESNKFGLEFAKSLFLFNSALVVALIAYLAKPGLKPPTTNWIEGAIGAFWLAWFVSLFVFVFGCLVNFYQGNSYTAADPSGEDAAWRSANRLSPMVYAVPIVVGAFMSVGLLCLLKAVRTP